MACARGQDAPRNAFAVMWGGAWWRDAELQGPQAWVAAVRTGVCYTGDLASGPHFGRGEGVQLVLSRLAGVPAIRGLRVLHHAGRQGRFLFRQMLGEGGDGGGEDFFYAAGEHELHVAAHFFRQLVEVLLVGSRKDDAADAGPVRGQDLLLNAPDRQHEAGERDLSGHGGVAAGGRGGVK